MTRIASAEEIILLSLNRPRTKKLVLTTGVFDILHAEHRQFLKKAKREGEILIVGIEPDTRVRAQKGEKRPVNSQEKRIRNLASENIADYVFVLPKTIATVKGREELVRKIKPQIYAVSSHTPFQEEKRRIMAKFNGQLKVVYPHNPRISTTLIITAKTKLRRESRDNI